MSAVGKGCGMSPHRTTILPPFNPINIILKPVCYNIVIKTPNGFKRRVRKIRLLLKDEDLRASLEEGTRVYAENDAWSKVAEQHLNLYEKVLGTS